MGRTLYLDCSSGISGDMTVAALLDLGASEEHLRQQLATLPVSGFDVVMTRVSKSGLAACDFDVRLAHGLENHDHDMAWLYGHEGAHEHAHDHGGEHEHDHAHDAEHAHAHEHDAEHTHHHEHACTVELGHDHLAEHGHGHHHHHDHHGHAHAHRSMADVRAIIEGSQLTARAQALALSIFGKLAEAEAAAHGATPDTVMFHEVGAVDSIVDICSVAICLDDLDVTDVIVTSLSEGHGTIRCAHGVMPIPVPAVANLCAAARIALVPADVAGELVTPTGAAVVAALRTGSRLPHSYAIERVGYGAGKRPYEGCSGVLRAMLLADSGGADAGDGDRDVVTKLECDLDDCTGEALGHVIELLMAAGAREAHAIPLVMKKGRPGHQLEVICNDELAPALERIIFENTTTIGIRSHEERRHALPRTPSTVETPFGHVETKRVVMPDGSVRAYPEYASVVAASERTGASFQDVFAATQAAGLFAKAGEVRFDSTTPGDGRRG